MTARAVLLGASGFEAADSIKAPMTTGVQKDF